MKKRDRLEWDYIYDYLLSLFVEYADPFFNVK